MILVDPRIGASKGQGVHGRHLVSQLRKLGAEATLADLKSGDVVFNGHGPEGDLRVGIEVKTLSDCLSGLQSHRLIDQVHELSRSFGARYLVLVGIWRPGPDGELQTWKGVRQWTTPGYGRQWTYTGFVRALTSLTAQAGVWVLRTPAPMEVPWAVYTLAQWWGDAWGSHSTFKGFHHTPPKPPAPWVKPSVAQKIAADLPHVGWEWSAAAAPVVAGALASVPPITWAGLRAEGSTVNGRKRPKLGMARAMKICAALDEEV